jgi:hypothetical protein
MSAVASLSFVSILKRYGFEMLVMTAVRFGTDGELIPVYAGDGRFGHAAMDAMAAFVNDWRIQEPTLRLLAPRLGRDAAP